MLGRDLSNRFSLEAYAADLGAAEFGANSELSYEVYGAQLVLHLLNSRGDSGRHHRDGLALYAKAGAGTTRNEGNVPFEDVDGDFLGNFGLGISGLIGGGVSWRLEAEAFDDNIAMVSLGLIKRFGSAEFKPDSSVSADSDSAPLEADRDVAARRAAFLASLEQAEEPSSAEFGSTAIDGTPPVQSIESMELETAAASNDKDGDGVPNGLDRCDDTPAGKSVDNSGCSFSGVVEGLYFASSSSDLDSAARLVLDDVILRLLQYPLVLVEVQAHTDNRGPAGVNLELSQARAEAVVRYMIQGGISQARLRSVGYGESRPAFQNATEEGRRRNRRVEFQTVE